MTRVVYTYHWHHLPSAKSGTRQFREPILGREALAWMNKWNAASDDWKYWLDPVSPYVTPNGIAPTSEEIT